MSGTDIDDTGISSAADVVAVIRRRIAAAELAPGTRLPEIELAEEFGVPRSRIREAFIALEQLGMIERIPNHGAMVTRLTAAQVLELYDIREVLDGLAVRLATLSSPPETWAPYVELYGEPAQRMVDDDDLDAFWALSDDFRQVVSARRNSSSLVALYDSLYERMGYVVRRLMLVPGRARNALGELRGIVGAMHRGDAYEAEALMRANLRSARAGFERHQKFLL